MHIKSKYIIKKIFYGHSKKRDNGITSDINQIHFKVNIIARGNQGYYMMEKGDSLEKVTIFQIMPQCNRASSS